MRGGCLETGVRRARYEETRGHGAGNSSDFPIDLRCGLALSKGCPRRLTPTRTRHFDIWARERVNCEKRKKRAVCWSSVFLKG